MLERSYPTYSTLPICCKRAESILPIIPPFIVKQNEKTFFQIHLNATYVLIKQYRIQKKKVNIIRYHEFWELKVVTNEKRGGSGSLQVFEDGTGPWRSTSVYFQCSRRLFFKVFTFPVCKAQLIGDWGKKKRRVAPKCSVRLFFKFFKVLSANRRTT